MGPNVAIFLGQLAISTPCPECVWFWGIGGWLGFALHRAICRGFHGVGAEPSLAQRLGGFGHHGPGHGFAFCIAQPLARLGQIPPATWSLDGGIQVFDGLSSVAYRGLAAVDLGPTNQFGHDHVGAVAVAGHGSAGLVLGVERFTAQMAAGLDQRLLAGQRRRGVATFDDQRRPLNISGCTLANLVTPSRAG